MGDERYRCAAASLARDEPLIGSASRVTSWLLVEQPGAWGPDALTESSLDAEVGRSLLSRCRAERVRVLLVRRRDRSTSERRQCFLAHTGVRSSWLESFLVDDPAELLGIDLGRARAVEPPGIGQLRREPICLVCTHGRHDACCADLGRPIVRALVAAGMDDVWESSHVGGDRFAGNVVSLPDGSYFGRVQPEEAPALVADLRRGVLHLDRYRGRSCYPPFVQAAELFARQASGVLDAGGLWLERVEPDGDDLIRATFGCGDGRRVEIAAAREPTSAAKLTCSALSDSPTRSYRVETVEVTQLSEGPEPPLRSPRSGAAPRGR